MHINSSGQDHLIRRNSFIRIIKASSKPVWFHSRRARMRQTKGKICRLGCFVGRLNAIGLVAYIQGRTGLIEMDLRGGHVKRKAGAAAPAQVWDWQFERRRQHRPLQLTNHQCGSAVGARRHLNHYVRRPGQSTLVRDRRQSAGPLENENTPADGDLSIQ